MAMDDDEGRVDGPSDSNEASAPETPRTDGSKKIASLEDARRRGGSRNRPQQREEREERRATPLPDAPWARSLALDGQGQLRSSAPNLLLLLRHLDDWRGILALDQFANRIVWRKPPPRLAGFPQIGQEEFADGHVLFLQAYFAKHYDVDFRDRALRDAAVAVARENAFDTARDYLMQLAWDGTERLSGWLTTYCGVEATPYTQAVGAAWMISAVARILDPGCKVDSLIVLEGPQGLGKSRALRALAGEYFLDHLPELSSKDARGNLAGHWIVELAELEGISRSSATAVKAFLSVQVDAYRPPYGRTVMRFPRRCVFAGTTNGQTWLTDDTGNRRFWPVRVSSPIDVAALVRDRDQLWAEARVRFEQGEPWHLVDRSVIALARQEQEARVLGDPWEPELSTIVDGKSAVTARAVLIAVKPRKFGHSKHDLMRVTEILAKLGWRKRRETRSEASARLGGQPSMRPGMLIDRDHPGRLVLWEPGSDQRDES